MKIAIDAMGGDHAPKEPVLGALQALKHIKSDIVLIGDEQKIKEILKDQTYDQNRISVIHTTEVIENEDKPAKAIKAKKDSSMVVGFKLLKEKQIDAFLSAGNTGALVAGGLLKVGRIKGIDRPALCSVYPTAKGISVLIDAGANSDSKPRNLYESGIMGSIYANKVLGIDKPRVGLANIGVEEGKGSSVVVEAYSLLKASDLNFIGNAEVRDIPDGVCDVIVCDGFTGNVILKVSEGVAKSFTGMLKEQILTSKVMTVASLLLKPAFSSLKKTMDYTEYGGAPFLGVDGLLVKAHGSSNSKAFMNGIRYAEKCMDENIVDLIKAELSKHAVEETKETIETEALEEQPSGNSEI